jgi:hypothetical protein
LLSAPLILVTFLICWLFALGADERLVLTPIACLVAILAFMIEQFWRRDRQLPVVDLGVLCVLITSVYIAVPSVFFVKSGFAWSDLSDSRLVQMRSTPEDVATVSWWVVAYLAALCSIYYWIRGAGMPGPAIAIKASNSEGLAILLIFVGCAIYQFVVERYFDVDLNPSNEALIATYGVQQLPLFLAQITNNVLGIERIAKLALIVFAISRKNWNFAALLVLWLCFEFYSALSVQGARTYFIVLVLAVILTTHRAIRPIGPIMGCFVATSIPAVLLTWGYFRDGTSADVWSAINEFQVLLANALHVSWAYDRGIIEDVPWALTLSDFFMLIPQQLLPFTKIDPSNWYIDQIGASDQGVGLMFGVVAQAKLGFGIIEIVARGGVLGLVLALIHRQCVKNASSLTAFIIYVWLCTSVYYTYRATTFYIATWALYRVLPFVVLFWLLRRFVGVVQGSGSQNRDTGNSTRSITPSA